MYIFLKLSSLEKYCSDVSSHKSKVAIWIIKLFIVRICYKSTYEKHNLCINKKDFIFFSSLHFKRKTPLEERDKSVITSCFKCHRIWCLQQAFLFITVQRGARHAVNRGTGKLNEANVKPPAAHRQETRLGYCPSPKRPRASAFRSRGWVISGDDKKVEGSVTVNFKCCWNRTHHGLQLLLLATPTKHYLLLSSSVRPTWHRL